MAKSKGPGQTPPSVMQVKGTGPMPVKNVPPAHIYPNCEAPVATATHNLQKLGSVTPPDTVMHKNRGNC